MHLTPEHRILPSLRVPLLAFGSLVLLTLPLAAQDGVTIFSGGNAADRLRVAAAEFKPGTSDPHTNELKQVFDTTLYSDLGNAGIFDIVSKSMTPQVQPSGPS